VIWSDIDEAEVEIARDEIIFADTLVGTGE
jgi:hypothetical protein